MLLAKDVAIQVCIMFIYISSGFFLAKFKKLSDSGAQSMTNILLLLVTPCVLIQSYQGKIDEFSPLLFKGLAVAAGFTLLLHFIAIVLATLFFPKEDSGRYKVSLFACVYSNCGFMAIPILQAVLGNDGVFYGSAYLALFTIIYWTHGVIVFSGSRKAVSLKALFFNPGVIGTVAALSLFLFRIKLPFLLSVPVNGVAALNTPLSMIILGTYLARVSLPKALTRPSLYKVSFIRLFLIPALSVFLLVFLSRLFPVDPLIATSVLIPASCPVAGVTALFAAKFKNDTTYASELVAITTLFSIVTIPLAVMLFSMFLK